MAIQKRNPAKRVATKKKTVPVKKKPAAKKVVTRISAAIKNKPLPKKRKAVAEKSIVTKKKAVSKKKIKAKIALVPVIETPVSLKQKDTIRKNISVDEHETEPVPAEQLSLPVPVTEEKKRKKYLFNKIKGLRVVRNYDPNHIQLNKVRKGGPKPSGKKPLW